MANSEELSADTVSAAEFIRNFARCREDAERRPVFVSNHRRQTHVLLGIADYTRLTEAGGAASSDEDDAAMEVLGDFSAWFEVGMIVCDSDFRIRSANAIASSLCRSSCTRMVGSNFLELPGVRGSLMESMVLRAKESNQPSTVEMPSPMAPDGWVNFRVVPWRHGNILIIRDITPEVQSQRMADVKGAILDAMALHGGVGYARVSVRGTVERVDAPMCDFIGLPENRIVGVPITDLIDISGRVEFRNLLEKVMRGEGARKVSSRLISNRGNPLDADMAIVPLHGTYGTEGAIVLLTPAETNS